ncbi:MAG: dihydrolipoamide acetyltransferase family protein [Solirubrobacteraceae bacterium]
MSSSPTDIRSTLAVEMPQMGVSVAEGTVIAWRVDVGDRIEANQTICEISTDKIDTEVPAPASGVVSEIVVPVGSTVVVGTVLARVAVPGSAASPAPGATNGSGGETARGHATVATANGSGEQPGTLVPASERPSSGHISPVVRRIAFEHGIDLAGVLGTGRGGRVRKQDVLALIDSTGTESGNGVQPRPEPPLHIESPYQPEPAPAPTEPAAAPAVGQLSRMRKQIGEHMKASLRTAAHCTTWTEADMARVEAERIRLRVTALAFVARATVAALREHPALNAWLEDGRYTRHDAVHLGIAVSLGDDGLIVPVIHDAHELSVEGLASRIRELAGRARARELTPDDVRGGTFTITNPGQFGSIMATPIINQPQVGILDLEAIVKRAVVLTDAAGNDSIAIRPQTILGLSWDHRALDGVQAAQFLATVKRHLEQPGAA